MFHWRGWGWGFTGMFSVTSAAIGREISVPDPSTVQIKVEPEDPLDVDMDEQPPYTKDNWVPTPEPSPPPEDTSTSSQATSAAVLPIPEPAESMDILVTFVMKNFLRNFEMIFTSTGSWVRYPRRRHDVQLPVDVEIVSNFLVTWMSALRWVQVFLEQNVSEVENRTRLFQITTIRVKVEPLDENIGEEFSADPPNSEIAPAEETTSMNHVNSTNYVVVLHLKLSTALLLLL